MKMLKLLEEITYIEYIGKKDVVIKGITYDSRKVEEGYVFSAVKGFKMDGHRFIENAINNGAAAIICEYIPENLALKTNYILVNNSKKAMAEIANVIYNKPSEKLNIIGITGTNGKTSITYLLKSILVYNKLKTGIIGTMGAVIDDRVIKLNNTTPESTDIHYILDQMVRKKINNCLMEVSSHALELNRVDFVSIDVGVFTNLSRDHLNFHGNMENYLKAKKKLFYLSKLNNVINIDDSYGERIYKELKEVGLNVVSYSIDKESDYRAVNIITKVTGTKFDLIFGDTKKNVHIKTPGKFSVYNSLGAIGAAHSIGLDLDKIIEGISTNPGVTGRFEVLNTKLECIVILDFAHTPDGLEKVMEAINDFATGRKIVLFGAGGERDVSRRSLMGEVAGRFCDLCILTSDNPRYEDPYKICEEIAEGVKEHHENYKIIVEREEAIRYAIENHEVGDVILLAGKGYEPYQVIGNERVPYDEKTVAKRVVREIEAKIEL